MPPQSPLPDETGDEIKRTGVECSRSRLYVLMAAVGISPKTVAMGLVDRASRQIMLRRQARIDGGSRDAPENRNVELCRRKVDPESTGGLETLREKGHAEVAMGRPRTHVAQNAIVALNSPPAPELAATRGSLACGSGRCARASIRRARLGPCPRRGLGVSPSRGEEIVVSGRQRPMRF